MNKTAAVVKRLRGSEVDVHTDRFDWVGKWVAAFTPGGQRRSGEAKVSRFIAHGNGETLVLDYHWNTAIPALATDDVLIEVPEPMTLESLDARVRALEMELMGLRWTAGAKSAP